MQKTWDCGKDSSKLDNTARATKLCPNQNPLLNQIENESQDFNISIYRYTSSRLRAWFILQNEWTKTWV